MSKLIVYKASAGSGKTFRLATEYIKQVIANPESFKNILAVTFTNKATAEMKGRILNELFAISKGESTAMGSIILKELKITSNALEIRAQRALSLILHDYSRFSISTIDSFVQRVIQALLWEIGQQGGIDIELDTAPVLEHAADNLLDSASQFDELLRWLTTMGYSLMEEGKSWDVRFKLIELGNQLFSEKFRLMSRNDINKFSDKERVNQLKVDLQKLSTSISTEIRGIAEAAYKELEVRDIRSNDFAYGNSGVMGFFKKCASIDASDNELPSAEGARVQKALYDPTGEEWVSKATFKSKILFTPIESAIRDVLYPTLTNLVETIAKQSAHFISARLILKNLENLALIGDLWSKVREISRDEGFLLLSDSGHLLREFVKESDAPFVYEKVGTRYDIYMIDEFQDTSEVQYHNFKPLMENSLAQDCFTMIVGDVKQSIYRWRNGDWSILASGIDNDFAHYGINEIPLNTNRRSLPSIIEFNNNFFAAAKEIAIQYIGNQSDSTFLGIESMQEQVEKAYKDLMQEPPSPPPLEKGYVELGFFEKSNNSDCDLILSREIPRLIKKLTQNHSLNDIAILVRSKGDGQRVANLLLEHNRNEIDKSQQITFVSQEGLQLKASLIVRLTIAAFRLVQDPTNEIAKRILAKEIATLRNLEKNNWHSYFQSSFTNDEVLWLSSLNTRPLQEVFEAIAHRYNLFAVSGELAHLAELHEHISTLSSKGNGDVNRFLYWWDQKSEKLSLSVPESTEGLTILTIHKSKGLQFPVVIIPYANWKFQPSNARPFLWVGSDEEPFNHLPKYPIQITKAAMQSLFAKDILEENMKVIVDNLNMLYVALTRPEKELYIFVPQTKKEAEGDIEELNSVSKLIKAVTLGLNPSSKRVDNEQGIETFCFGEPFTRAKESIKEIDKSNSWIMDSYPVGETFQGIKLRLESEEFFLSSPSNRYAPLEHGKVMHELFSKIVRIDDVDSALQLLMVEGLLDRTETEDMSRRIKDILGKEPFSDWFSGNWQVKAEFTILTPQGHNFRPDRVMVKNDHAIVVDFKFGAELPSHPKQVSRYMDLLKGMGYNTIEGYVWYVDQNKVKRVNEG